MTAGMRQIAALVVTLVATLGPPAPARADFYGRCVTGGVVDDDSIPLPMDKDASSPESGDMRAGLSDRRILNCTKAIRSGDYQGAKLASLYRSRAEAHEHLGDDHSGVEDLDRALALEPTDADTYVSRARAHARLGDLRRALADLDQLVALRPDSADAWRERGVFQVGRGNFGSAIEDFDQAVLLRPTDASLFRDRARTYEQLGDIDRAIADMDEVVRIGLGYGEDRAYRGRLYWMAGEHQRALNDFDEAIAVAHRGPFPARVQTDAYWGRGYVHMFMDNPDQAVRDWEKSLEINGAPLTEYTQQYLKERGLYAGSIDGNYGPELRRALEAFARLPHP